MGKATRWFRSLLGLKKESPAAQEPVTGKPPKRRWSFFKSHREKYAAADRRCHNEPAPGGCDNDPSRQAIAVAAATAAVAEAAVAAAEAAAEVVRLTSSRRCSAAPADFSGRGVLEEYWAAIKIQSHFRAYLARRALRALKGLVKLQALVRGHIVRKQTAEMLRRMQALLRAQARARAERAQIAEYPYSTIKSSQFHHPAPATPEKFEHTIRSKITTKHERSLMLKRTGSKSAGQVIVDQAKAHNGRNWIDCQMDERSRDQRRPATKPIHPEDEKSDKILEVDTVKPHFTRKLGKNPIQSSCHSLASDQCSHRFSTSRDLTTHQTAPSPSSSEVQSLSPLKFAKDEESESPFCTADNSPQFYSASSRGGISLRGPFTPARSDGSRSCLSGYSDHPNYMACTESSRAKTRSLSAPKQRPQLERSFSTKRYSVHGYVDSRSSTQRVFASKAYPGSGRLDRLGVP